MTEMWGIPDGSTFEDEFNRNFQKQFGEPANPDWVDPNSRTSSSASAAQQRGMSSADVQRMIDDAINGINEQNTARNRASAISMLNEFLSQWGMGELSGNVEGLITEWGNNPGVVADKLRQTDTYKQRFKGLLQLQSKGVTDIQNEAEYVRMESQYRQVFRDAGLQNYLGAAGSRDEIGAIAKLVGDYSISVDEVRGRVRDAQRIVTEDTPAEVRDSLQRYYNVSPSDLVGYMLDPARGSEQINRMANAAMAGGFAQRAGLNLDAATAGQIAGTYGDQDINTGQIRSQFTNAAGVRDATARLANIESTDLTDSEIVQSELDLDPNAKKKVAGLQSRERARFSGTSGVSSSSLSRSQGI